MSTLALRPSLSITLSGRHLVARFSSPHNSVCVAVSVDVVAIMRKLAAFCKRMLARARSVAGDDAASVPRVRDKLYRALAAIAGERYVGDLGDTMAEDEVVGRIRIATRTERREARAARKAKRKRGVDRFKRTLARAAKALARSKLVSKLRQVWQGIMGGKLVNKALKVAGPALGGAFGGPLGAMLGGKLAAMATAQSMSHAGTIPQLSTEQLYRLGCQCG